MFQEMRREDRKLSKNEAVQILMENQYGVLSTVCEDGYPYGVPLSYVYENETLYFHGTNEVSLKDNNIGISTKACFTVIGKTELLPAKFATKYESVIAFGRIKKSTDKQKILKKIVEKYSLDYMESGEKYILKAMNKVTVYEFEIEYMSAKAKK